MTLRLALAQFEDSLIQKFKLGKDFPRESGDMVDLIQIGEVSEELGRVCKEVHEKLKNIPDHWNQGYTTRIFLDEGDKKNLKDIFSTLRPHDPTERDGMSDYDIGYLVASDVLPHTDRLSIGEKGTYQILIPTSVCEIDQKIRPGSPLHATHMKVKGKMDTIEENKMKGTIPYGSLYIDEWARSFNGSLHGSNNLKYKKISKGQLYLLNTDIIHGYKGSPLPSIQTTFISIRGFKEQIHALLQGEIDTPRILKN